MARKRMIDPEFWLDEGVAELSPLARLLYIGLWGVCDDNYATLPNRPKWIKAQIFPYDKNESVNIPQLLNELSTNGKIVLFTANDGEQYYYIKNFFKYQRVEKPSKPKYPQYDENKRVLPDSSPTTPAEVKLREVKRREVNIANDKSSAKTEEELLLGKQINEILGLFKPINPMYGKFFENKTQRAAVERLIKTIGFEKLKNLVEKLPPILEKPYAPRISTPINLENKIGDLRQFFAQEKERRMQQRL